jgi:hypothetical protein
MNVVFGSAAATSTGSPGSWHRGCGVRSVRRAATDRHFTTPDRRAQVLGAFTDGGAIVGHAESGGAALVYIGAITHPVDGWAGDGSPIDDPSATARFLLDRYAARGA